MPGKPSRQTKAARAAKPAAKRQTPAAGPAARPPQPPVSEWDRLQRRVAELEAREAERARFEQVQAALYRIADAAGAAQDMQTFYATMHHIVGELMYAPSFYLILADEARQLAVTEYWVDEAGDPAPAPTPLALPQSPKRLVSLVRQTGKPLHASKEEIAAMQARGEVAPYGTLSEDWIGMPLKFEGNFLGVLVVQSYKKGIRYSDQDVELLTFVAQHIATALTRARALDAERQRTEELAIINSVQTALASKLDFQGIVDAVGDKLTEIFSGENVAIGFLDKASGMLKLPYVFENGKRIGNVEFPLGDKGLASHVARTLQPLVINANFDQRAEELGAVSVSDEPNPKSWLGVPIILDGEYIGGFALQNWERENAYTDSHVRLLQTLAGSLGVALANARLFAEVQKKNAEITESLERETASNDILRVIAESPTNIQPVLDVIARNAAQLSGSEDAIIAIKDGDILRVSAHYGDIPMIPVGEGIRFNRDSVAGRAMIEGWSLQAIHNRRGVKSEYPEGDEVAKKYGYRMTCAVPLMREGKAIGAITIRRTEPELLTDKQIALIQSFANQAAIAVENVRLFEAEQQRVAELAVINSVQAGLASKLDFEGIVDLVGEKLREIFDAQVTFIGLVDHDTKMVSLPYYVEDGKHFHEEPFPLGEGLTSFVIHERKRLIINENFIEIAAQLGAKPSGSGKICKSWAGIPIIAGERVIGIISLQNYEREKAFPDSDVNLVGTIASSLGVALENARLFDEVQRKNAEITEALEQQTATSEILKVIASSPADIQPVLDAISENALKLCGANFGAVYSYDGKMLDMTSLRNFTVLATEEIRREYPRPLARDGGYSARSILEKRVIHVVDAANDPGVPEVTKPLVAKLGFRSGLWVPMIRDNNAIGAFCVARPEPGPFTAKQIDLLKTFADQATIAIENVRLFTETQRLLKETEQRNAELAIVNSVQAALAAKLDMQGIYDAVGDKIRNVFDAQIVTIVSYDRATERNIIHYAIENGERHSYGPQPTTDLYKELMATGTPIIVQEKLAERLLGKAVPMEDSAGHASRVPKSGVWIPLSVAGTVMGHVSLQNVDRENAFSESDIRLLTTLANSMSVALESARLFDETQRLLAETEQRAAELAIINAVGQALARQLDFQAIIDLVGDKIREIFDAQAVVMSLVDRQADAIHHRYLIERGQRYVFDAPVPVDQFRLKVIRSQQPWLINQDYERVAAELGEALVLEGEVPRSLLFVPMIIGDEVTGIISLQNLDRENAFTESDVRLLTTITANMGVALENARLFDETQRLLKETEQRAAELEIISSVGQVLTQELDLRSLMDLVGDKLRTAIQADNFGIGLYESKSKLLHSVYVYRDDQRVYPDPAALNAFSLRVARQGRPLVINHNTRETWKKFGSNLTVGADIPKSVLMIPILASRELIGGITVQDFARENAYPDSLVRMLETIATSMGTAIQNARLFDETRRLLAESNQRAAELATVNTVGQAIASQLELDTLIQLIGEQMRQTFNADIVYLALRDSQTNLINFPYEYGQHLPSIPLGQGLTSRIIESGQPLLINENLGDRTAQLGTQRIGVTAQSYLGVPISVGKQAIGVISVQSTQQEGRFGEADLRLLSTIAASVGVAIQNARLYQETQRRAEEMATLTELGREISATLDLPTVLERIVTRAGQLLGTPHGFIYLLAPGEAELERKVGVGVYSDNRVHRVKPGEGLSGQVWQTDHPIVVDDYDTWPGRSPQGMGLVQAMVGVPLHSGSEVAGVLALASERGSNRTFGDEDVELLRRFAQLGSIAIQNARLFDETNRRASEMAALTEIGREISATLDLPAVLERIATRAQAVMSAQDVVLRLLEPDGALPAVVAIGRHAEQQKALTLRLGQGLTGHFAQAGVAEIVNHPTQDPRIVHVPGTSADEDEREAIIIAPLVSREKVIGVMNLWRDRIASGPFTQRDLDFLAGLARQAAIAIENARLFDEVQQQKQYSEAVVQNSPVAIVTTDLAAHVVAWNPAAEGLFGYSASEVIGRNVDELVATEEVRAEAMNYTQQVTAEGRVKAVTRRARKDGTLVDVELLALPVVVGGEQVGLIAIYHDITELQRAKREAETANAAKSAFLATMSHEIRTPMNAIIGMSGLLLDTPLDDEQREFATIISNSGDALLTIINDILDFSKIEAGKMELERQPFDPRECVESALDLVAPRAAEKGLDLAYVVEDDVPAAIVGDVTRLRQILLNLLTNAVKFTEEGEVVLSVTRGASAASSPVTRDSSLPYVLHFTVRDTGVGIPPDRMDRLFQSFSQIDASTARKYGGTGLGLAISKRLAELMGGAMWAESPPVSSPRAAPPSVSPPHAGGIKGGPGAAFHFTLRTEAAETPVAARRDLRGAQPQLRDRRVLIVDDNDTNRRILVLHTQAWGMTPRDTASPTEALDWLRRGDPFDVAILDMHMPGMDGIAVASEIRALRSPLASLPLILFTSLGRREAGAEAVGFAAHLTKPIKPSQLFDALAGIFAEQATSIQRSGAPQGQIDPAMALRLPLRILLAEDNAVNQKLALRLLQQMGYRADVAGNGLEAVEAVERQTYDVVLMDVQMPEMDGLEASRQITWRWPPGRRPRIIAMTANAMQGDREMCLAAGMDDYLTKPIRVAELVGALSRSQPRPAEGDKTDMPPPVIDTATLEELVATTDAAFVAELLSAFFDDAPQLIALLKQAAADHNAEAFRRAAHSIKSTSANFGATDLSALAKELELMGKAGRLEGTDTKIERLAAEYRRAEHALREWQHGS